MHHENVQNCRQQHVRRALAKGHSKVDASIHAVVVDKNTWVDGKM